MDFKAALLKSQPSTAAASVFKPTAGDATTDQDAHPAASFNASGNEGKDSAVKVCGHHHLDFHWLL